MKNSAAQGKSLKIAVIYFVIGCAWIFFSDKFVQLSFSEQSLVLFYSIAKGFLYVFATSILIYALTYPALKEVLDGKEALQKTNAELNKSNELFKNLCQDYNEEQALLKSLIDTIPDLIFYKDTNSVYLGCNAAFESFAGKQEQDIIGHTDRDLFPAEEAALFINMDMEILSKDTFRKNEVNVTYPDGKEVVLETVKTPYHDFEGTIIGLIGISRDITERKCREEKVQYISYHDTMTGIYNRTYFEEARIALDHPDQLPLSVIVGDVNGMKLINDAFGHAKGDLLLKEIANILEQCVRKGDIVARTGGDEFSILMPNADEKAVKGVVDRIRAMCEEKRREEHNDIYIDMHWDMRQKANRPIRWTRQRYWQKI